MADAAVVSEYQIRSMQDDHWLEDPWNAPSQLPDHWLAVQHLPCEKFLIGDEESFRHQISADEVWKLMQKHRCDPRDLEWVRSQNG